MDDSLSSLNTTFCIEEETSFLANFGTPLQFKKLLDRPATVACGKFNHKAHISIKDASNIRLNNQLYNECNAQADNNSTFLSPLPIKRELQRNKFNNFSNIIYNKPLNSPLNFGFSSPLEYSRMKDNENKHQAIKLNNSPMTKFFEPIRDMDGNILKSSVRKAEEERKKRQMTGEVSPSFREMVLDKVRRDAKAYENGQYFDVSLDFMARNNSYSTSDDISTSYFKNAHKYISPINCNDYDAKDKSPFTRLSSSPMAIVYEQNGNRNGMILMSSSRKKEEFRKQQKMNEYLSPITFERRLTELENDKKALENKLNLDYSNTLNSSLYCAQINSPFDRKIIPNQISPAYMSPINCNRKTNHNAQISNTCRTEKVNYFSTPIRKPSSENTDGFQTPNSVVINYKKYRMESDKKKLESQKTEFQYKKIEPLRDSDGNILMSSVRKKELADEEMKRNGIPTAEVRNKYLEIVNRDARKYEQDAKMKLENETKQNESKNATKVVSNEGVQSQKQEIIEISKPPISTISDTSGLSFNEKIKLFFEKKKGIQPPKKVAEENKENVPVDDKDAEFRKDLKAYRSKCEALFADGKMSKVAFGNPNDSTTKTRNIAKPVVSTKPIQQRINPIAPREKITQKEVMTNRWR